MREMKDIVADIERLLKEAYQKGWDDAVSQIVGAVRATAAGSGVMKQNVANKKSEQHSFQKGSAIDLVYNLIQEKQGLTSAEVVKGMNDKGVEEKAVRTALYRLHREKRLIENREEKWFPKE